MKLTRLPTHPECAPQEWEWGKDNTHLILLPGESLLSETLPLPAGVKSSRDIRRWLGSNTDEGQWDRQKELLLKVGKESNLAWYWAVDRQLWRRWQRLIRNAPGNVTLLPDWMLLPPSSSQGYFALQAGDSILFRQNEWSGGALPLAMSDLFTSMNPRWLCLPGSEKGELQISVSWLRDLACRHRHLMSSGRRAIPWDKALSVLLIVSAAVCVEQAGEYAWLRATREPASPQKVVLPASRMQSGLERSLELLQQIQQQGPIQLRSMVLDDEKAIWQLSSPLSCGMLRSRLASLPLQGEFKREEHGCRAIIRGDLL